MLSSGFFKATLFRTAAGISFVSALHHIHRGCTELYSPWQTLPPKPQRAARTAWDYMNVAYGLLVLLNWRWSRVGGPRTTEEGCMLAVAIIGGLVEARRCHDNGERLPLVAFLGIPGLSLLGSLL